MGSVTVSTRVDKATGKTVQIHRAYIRREGFESKSKVFRTATAARNWLRENEAASALDARGSGKTLNALIEDFVLAPPTRGTKFWTAQHLDFWKAELGTVKVGELSRGVINGAISTLQARQGRHSSLAGVLKTGQTLSPATVNRYLASLSSVMNYAMGREIIDSHPMKAGRVKKLKEGNGRRRVLTKAEEDALMTAARASSWAQMALFLRMCLTTAARKAEVLNLRWDDLRLDDSVAVLGITKNGMPRALPLVADVKQALTEASKVEPRVSPFVFYDPRHPERPKVIKDVWTACRAKAGLLNDRDDPLDRVVLHTTRHTAVTKMVKGGANLAQAAAVSGHQTLSQLKRYEHLASADAVDVAQRLLGGGAT